MTRLAGVCVLLLAGRAAASTIAVLPLQASGEAERLSGPARIELHRGLGRHGQQPIPLARVDRLLLATELACRRPECLARSAGLLGADLLVGGRLELGGGSATLALWLFEGARAITLATHFERGHPGDLGALCSRALDRLLRPSGQPLPLTLQAMVASPDRPAGPRSSALRWTKWGTGAAGLVAVSLGAGLWAAGRTGGADPRGAEPVELRDLRPAGIALVAMGAALVVTSAVCFVVDARRGRSAEGSGTR